MLKYFLLSIVLLTCVSNLYAEIVGNQVEYEVDGTVMKGYIAFDSKFEGKRPGVLVVHEWWGHNDYARKRADMLAELGYVAFALDMYGEGKQLAHPKDAGAMAGQIRGNRTLMLNRFRSAMSLLQHQQLTDEKKLAAIGYCFGGGIVLEMARSGEPLLGVVSFHGSLATDNPANAEQNQTRVLVLNGAADPFVKPEQIASFKKEMQDAKMDFEFISYPDAKHAFTNPDADEYGTKFNLPLAYNEKADHQSWQEMHLFLNKIFN